jgi:hypothetical protein
MTWHPRFRLYAADGTTPVYEFEYVQNLPDWQTDNPSNIEITNLRSQGSINIPGGDKSADLNLQGILIAANYEALTTAVFALTAAVVANTNFILKIDKSPSTTDTIRVRRVVGIKWEESKRLTMIKYTVTFKTLSW